VELHHPSGRQNDPRTVPVPGNDHRILSELQRTWVEVQRNPSGSPLLKAAAGIYAWMDILRVLLDRILVWIPRFLEELDAYLCATLGDQWWDQVSWGVRWP
jgi:hypothetical protein